MAKRVVLHVDANGFFASVECMLDPSLKSVPLAVGGDIENRHGIILAKNEIAKKYGVVTAETVISAKRKCPGLVIVPPSHAQYEKYSRLLNEIYLRYTDLTEPFGIDESWLDITGTLHLFSSKQDRCPYDTAKRIADEIRQTVKDELGLTVSVGVSFNKVFAKLGSDYKKPDATTVITENNFKNIVYPLPVSDLLFVGKSSKEVLSSLMIHTIGQLAEYDLDTLKKRLGKMGEMIYRYARGEDEEPVGAYHQKREIKSVGNGMTYKKDISSAEDIDSALSHLCDEVSSRMRNSGLKCKTVSLTVKYSDLKTAQKQKPLVSASSSRRTLFDTVSEIMKLFMPLRCPIRSFTVTASNFVSDSEGVQLSMIEDEDKEKKFDKIDKAVDEIRTRFGKEKLKTANTIKTDIGIE